MKKAHAYAPSMGMTVREAADKLAVEWKYSAKAISDLQYPILEWELFSGDPKIRDITDDQFDKFEVAMIQAGMASNTSYKWSTLIRRIVARVRLGDQWMPRKAIKGGGIKAPPTRNDGTLRAFFHLQYKRMRLRGKPPGTIHNYEIAFRHFAKFLGRPAKLSDLTNDNVGDLMQWLVDHGRANRTANKNRDMLCAVWRFANSEGKLRKGPNVMPLDEPTRAPVAWTKSELAKLWAACKAETGHVRDTPAATWWLALHSVLWNSAERIGAVLLLKWSEVDLDEGFINFRAETRKFRKTDNVAKLHDVTIALLRGFPSRDPETLVFSWPKCRSSLWNHYRSLLKHSGLAHDRGSKFHRMRKSAATWFEVTGGNATDLLLHTSRQVTKSYLDVRIIGKTHGADLLFNPDGSPTVDLPAPDVGKTAEGGREQAGK
jgi:integrase